MATILIAVGIILCAAVVIYIGMVVSNWLDFNSVLAKTHYVYLTYDQLINYLARASCTFDYDNSTAWLDVNKYPGRIRIKMPFFSYLKFIRNVKKINKNGYAISYDKIMADYTFASDYVQASEEPTNENH